MPAHDAPVAAAGVRVVPLTGLPELGEGADLALLLHAAAVAALGGLAVFAVLLATRMQAQPQVLATVLFQLMGGAVFGYALLAGVLHTAELIGTR